MYYVHAAHEQPTSALKQWQLQVMLFLLSFAVGPTAALWDYFKGGLSAPHPGLACSLSVSRSRASSALKHSFSHSEEFSTFSLCSIFRRFPVHRSGVADYRKAQLHSDSCLKRLRVKK